MGLGALVASRLLTILIADLSVAIHETPRRNRAAGG